MPSKAIREDRHYGLVIAGFSMLLCAAYIDNCRGPLLPVFKELFKLNYTQTSVFLSVAYATAILCNFGLISLLNRFGEIKVCVGTCLLALVTVFVSQLVDSHTSLLIFGLLLGAVIATFGTLCNVLIVRGTPPGARVKMMCGLHSMYGTGSLMAPGMVLVCLRYQIPWPWVFLSLPPLLVAITLVLLVKNRNIEEAKARAPQSAHINLPQALFLLTMSFYVGGEVTLSMWLTSFLNEAHALSIQEAAPYLSGFFMTMVVSRIACIPLLRNNNEWLFIWGGIAGSCLFFTLGRLGFLWGFVLAGLLGPVFPVFFGKLSDYFPNQWRSLTVWTITLMQVTLATFHFLIGKITDHVGIETAYWVPLGLLGLTAMTLFTFTRIAGAPK